ncbi:hypothetical protein AMTR_s00006p00065850 [Amborella trichopoda]|uniref:Uncharacterized protein n=1 Tax=Amborella trichopoda TaxID=13333 RepID=W1PD50_AMBTC|nr:hypothetical protein AMTR_s00006p00065850 [Amborella trichopoda]
MATVEGLADLDLRGALESNHKSGKFEAEWRKGVNLVQEDQEIPVMEFIVIDERHTTGFDQSIDLGGGQAMHEH